MVALGSCSSDPAKESSAQDATTAAESAATTVATPIETSAPATTAEPAPTDSPATTAPATTAAPTTTAAATTTTPPIEPLHILVTNDDGYAAAGIDAVVEYLRTLPDVDVTVVAPLANQSGAGDRTTPGGATAITDVTTASGYPAKAVDGSPADSVLWALGGGVATRPDLVVSGSNLGQNYSAVFIPISGTIGAAATAARNGIPGIAISQGLAHEGQPELDYPASIRALTEYLDATLDSYRAGQGMPLVSINVPTCPVGVVLDPEISQLFVAPPAADFGERAPLAPSPCTGSATDPVDDVDAFNNGQSVLTALDPATLAGVDYTGVQPGA
ncbi:MAG: 5'/3'-nucleotidase SurE [Ilumatobacteraceae bacterium]